MLLEKDNSFFAGRVCLRDRTQAAQKQADRTQAEKELAEKELRYASTGFGLVRQHGTIAAKINGELHWWME